MMVESDLSSAGAVQWGTAGSPPRGMVAVRVILGQIRMMFVGCE